MLSPALLYVLGIYRVAQDEELSVRFSCSANSLVPFSDIALLIGCAILRQEYIS